MDKLYFKISLCLLLMVTLTLTACRDTPPERSVSVNPIASQSPPTATAAATLVPTEAPSFTPTPSPPPPSPSMTLTPSMTPSPTLTPWPTLTMGPTPTLVPGWYTIESGDTLSGISARFDMWVEEIMELNRMEDTAIDIDEILAVWQPINQELPASYLIHDSEVVYSPVYLDWDTEAFVEAQGGFLADYTEVIPPSNDDEEAQELSGAEIIEQVAFQYHVGPRVLLATMELMSGWVTKNTPTNDFAFGLRDPSRAKLSKQAAWAAQELMYGYYTRLEGRQDWVRLSSGGVARAAPTTNPGSAAVINLLGLAVRPASDLPIWLEEERFQKTYQKLFGNIDGGSIMPPDGKQPYFAMPWPDGEKWAFSGGPHGGYIDYSSGWAALDFAPPVKNGCRVSESVIHAIAPGLVVSSDDGETWIDMDEDGNIHTGWSLLYMHLASKGQIERIEKGEYVEVGDKLGNPSCEGGHSSAAHVHIARMYNGQWMPADRPVPFQIGDWVASAKLNNSYKGYLYNTKTEQELEASFAREEDKNIFPGEVGR